MLQSIPLSQAEKTLIIQLQKIAAVLRYHDNLSHHPKFAEELRGLSQHSRESCKISADELTLFVKDDSAAKRFKEACEELNLPVSGWNSDRSVVHIYVDGEDSPKTELFDNPMVIDGKKLQELLASDAVKGLLEKMDRHEQAQLAENPSMSPDQANVTPLKQREREILEKYSTSQTVDPHAVIVSQGR